MVMNMTSGSGARDGLRLRLSDPNPESELSRGLSQGSSICSQGSQGGSDSDDESSTDTKIFGVKMATDLYRCSPFSKITPDTRTHVVVELFDNERLYVEALQILVVKYLQPLKSPENAGLVEAMLVDEIFFMVPAILAIHEVFLEELRRRLEAWDAKQKVGDVFLKVFGDHSVMETYTAFINNWKKAKEAIKATTASKPAFARFIEAMARENKGKLALDNLLIKPVQKIPKYELLLQRLIKHTDTDHPDHRPLLEAQRQVHELLVRINCTEQQSVLRELEGLGLDNLVEPERTYLRHDLVSMHSGQGTRKERALFLFSDLLIITSIKRRSGTIRKPSTTFPGSVASTLEANKYKLLMRIPLDDLEIMKDETKTSALREMESLSEDQAVLSHISEQVATLRCQHGVLEDAVKDLQAFLARQQAERQATDSQLSYLEMTLNTPRNGIENISMVFTKPEKRASWEEAFNEAKQKLALSADRRPAPEFVSPVPIRKTRAGLQFTCAAPTLEAGPVVNVGLTTTTGSSLSISHHIPNRDVWVCNSDGYVGQVCVLSLHPEPTVTSCNGVCNARILCVASVPAGITGQINSPLPHQYPNRKTGISISVEDTDRDNLSGNIQLDSGSSSEDEDYVSEAGPETEQSTAPPSPEPQQGTQGPPGTVTDEGADSMQPTMWLGTEDGCIHVYNCSDNIRIKKNKLKIQHASAVYSVIYLDNKVFVSLANGDISVYTRDHNGWNTSDPMTISVGSSMAPVTKLLPVAGRLWCAAHNHIKVLNTQSLQVERSFPINSDTNKPITNMAACGLGVWISLQNSAILKCFHAANHECLFEVNIAASVTKMLASCDDIIRQHKAACLRITALLACKDLLWVGTSAGVILTMPVPHIGMSTGKSSTVPTVTGVHHGHTGHVRFLTYIENTPPGGSVNSLEHASPCHRYSLKAVAPRNTSSLGKGVDLGGAPLTTTGGLVISGGDGYEDFRNVGAASEVAGREDSTNHLLLWQV